MDLDAGTLEDAVTVDLHAAARPSRVSRLLGDEADSIFNLAQRARDDRLAAALEQAAARLWGIGEATNARDCNVPWRLVLATRSLCRGIGRGRLQRAVVRNFMRELRAVEEM